MLVNGKSVVIDPSSSDYLENKLFDLSNKILNRDDTLLPFNTLKDFLGKKNIQLNTIDLLINGRINANKHQYFSLGISNNLSVITLRNDIELKGFIIMEPPVVAPELYKALPYLTKIFEYVYVHNTIGDGYSLNNVNQSKLQKFYWPQPYKGVLEKHWFNTNRLNRIVVINGNHKPKSHKGELYSKRINAMASLSKLNCVDLYGRGWARWYSRTSLWLPYWLNRNKLMSIYKGECISKHDILSKYRFCLCYENMEMNGYISEKIFDCLYTGTIPIYYGAPDIATLLPPDTYIDARKFSSFQKMWESLEKMDLKEVNNIREAGKVFLESDKFLEYFNSLYNIIGKD